MYLIKVLRKIYEWLDRKITLKNIIWLLFVFVFTLILLEIAARVYLGVILEKSSERKFQFNYYRIYSHIPGFREGDGESDWMIINNQGFRRTEDVKKEKPESTFRVFLMGGSAAHGISSAPPYPVVHIYQHETVDAYLEKMLEEKYPDKNIEIINAAVTGYHVFQHTAYIMTTLFDYDPDLIIFFDGYNDHFAYNPDYDYYEDNIYQFWKPRLQTPSISGMFDYFALWLSDYSALARGYYAWKLQHDAFSHERKLSMAKKYNSDEEMISAHKQVAGRQFLRNIRINFLMLQQYNVDAILCFQPGLILRDKELLSEKEKGFYEFKLSVQIPVLFPYIIKELEDAASEFNAPFVNMVSQFNKPEYKGRQLFIDYCHMSPEGSEAAARALLPEVEKNMLKRFGLGGIAKESILDTISVNFVQDTLPINY